MSGKSITADLAKLKEQIEQEKKSLKRDRKKFPDIDQRMALDNWVKAFDWTLARITELEAESP